jgi:hypothetical protein
MVTSSLCSTDADRQVFFFGGAEARQCLQDCGRIRVVAWLLIQIAMQVFPFFEIPNWVVRLVVLLLIIGFPVALVLAWAFEITPEEIKRTEEVDLGNDLRLARGSVFYQLGFLTAGVIVSQ